MRVRLHETPEDGWLNVRFIGVPGVREDASHVWLAPRADNTWELSFQVERESVDPDIQEQIDWALAAGFSVHECTGRHVEVVRVADLGYAERGAYYLDYRKSFETLTDAKGWLRQHGRLLFMIADDADLQAHRGPDRRGLAPVWSELDDVAEQIGREWPEGVSAADALDADRREL